MMSFPGSAFRVATISFRSPDMFLEFCHAVPFMVRERQTFWQRSRKRD